jgi:hypothetical protein
MTTSITVKTGAAITTLSTLMSSIINDMTSDATPFFTKIFPTTAITPGTDGSFIAVLESTAAVNPVNSTQKYRVYIEVQKNESVRVAIANPTQIGSTGTVASYPGTSAFRASNIAGMLGRKWDDASTSTTDIDPGSLFIVRAKSTYTDLTANPMSYQLGLSDHGFYLWVWGDAQEKTPQFSWVAVQSPVDNKTGAPLTTDHSPIFCVYSPNNRIDSIYEQDTIQNLVTTLNTNWPGKLNSLFTPAQQAAIVTSIMNGIPPTTMYTGTPVTTNGNASLAVGATNTVQGYQSAVANSLVASAVTNAVAAIAALTVASQTDMNNASITTKAIAAVYKFVVNESDVAVPTPSVRANIDSPISSAILNSNQQVGIATGNKYLITIPNRLNTNRYAYTHELDLIAYSAADVISQESEIPLTLYGETNARVYRAMQASGANNTLLRMLTLTQASG